MARKPLGVQFAFPATASSLPAHHLERTPPQTTRSWPTQDSALTGGYLLKKSLPHGSATALQTRHVPASEIAAFIQSDQISALLRPWLPDDGERALVVRCLLDVGPAHHRGSNYILLRLIGLLLENLQVAVVNPPMAAAAPIPMRVPPAVQAQEEPMEYPLGVPIAALERLAPKGSRSLAAMVDCLTDGPPQHSLGNAAMLCLLEALLSAAMPPLSGDK
jgi:hypothetical protein